MLARGGLQHHHAGAVVEFRARIREQALNVVGENPPGFQDGVRPLG